MLCEGAVLGALNILTDLMILTIPMPLVWKLQIGVWRRLSLAITFLLGSFVVFASIYRFSAIFQSDPNDYTCTAPPPAVRRGRRLRGARGAWGANEG